MTTDHDHHDPEARSLHALVGRYKRCRFFDGMGDSPTRREMAPDIAAHKAKFQTHHTTYGAISIIARGQCNPDVEMLLLQAAQKDEETT